MAFDPLPTADTGPTPPDADHYHRRTNAAVNDLQTALSGKVDAAAVGQPGGVASLDQSGTVPLDQLPDEIGGAGGNSSMVTSVNGHPGPAVTLDVGDIEGAVSVDLLAATEADLRSDIAAGLEAIEDEYGTGGGAGGFGGDFADFTTTAAPDAPGLGTVRLYGGGVFPVLAYKAADGTQRILATRDDVSAAAGAGGTDLAAGLGILLSPPTGGVVTVSVDRAEIGGVIASANGDRVVANTTADTELASFTVPGGLVDAGDVLRFAVFGDLLSNSGAPTWAFVLRMSWTSAGEPVVAEIARTTATGIAAGAARRGWRCETDLHLASLTAQRAWSRASWSGGAGGGSNMPAASQAFEVYKPAAADFSGDVTLSWSVVMSVANAAVETTRRAARLELVRGV